MKRASLMVLLIAFAFALPAVAAGPANTAPALQAPAVATAPAAPAVALPTPDAASLIAGDVSRGTVHEATTCTRTVLCYDGTHVTCTGSVCDWEPRCFVWCDTTGYVVCRSPCA
jgi:hypothetical protein